MKKRVKRALAVLFALVLTMPAGTTAIYQAAGTGADFAGCAYNHPAILEKEIGNVVPGMIRERYEDAWRYRMFTTIDWELRVGIPASIGGRLRRPVNNPIPAGFIPERLGNPAYDVFSPGIGTGLPNNITGWGTTSVWSPTYDGGTGGFPVPSSARAPAGRARYGTIDTASFFVVRDVLDWRLRLDVDSVEVSFDTSVGQVNLPGGPSGPYWKLVNYVFDFTGPDNHPIRLPNGRVIRFCQDKYNAGIEQGVNVFWVHLTQAGRMHIANHQHFIYLNCDKEPDLGFIRINFDTNLHMVYDGFCQSTCTNQGNCDTHCGHRHTHGHLINDGTLAFGRQPHVSASDRSPPEERETHLLNIRIYKHNPSAQPLDGAIFYLWCESNMGDPDVAPFHRSPRPIDSSSSYWAYRFDLTPQDDYRTWVYPPIRRAITGDPTDPERVQPYPPPYPPIGTSPTHEMHGQRHGEALFTHRPEGSFYLLEFQGPPGGYTPLWGWRQIYIVLDDYAQDGNIRNAYSNNNYTVVFNMTNTRDLYSKSARRPRSPRSRTSIVTIAFITGVTVLLFILHKTQKRMR